MEGQGGREEEGQRERELNNNEHIHYYTNNHVKLFPRKNYLGAIVHPEKESSSSSSIL